MEVGHLGRHLAVEPDALLDDPEALFALTCARARFSTVQMAAAERKRQADLAVAALQKAAQAGFRELPRLRKLLESPTVLDEV